jgi:hypothetical protein
MVEDLPMSNWTHANIGSLDRALRALIGIAALALVVTGPRTAWGYLGLIPLVTAAFSFCPLYAMLGLETRNRRVR